MTLPKKGFRKITVNDIMYQYKVTGEDYGINVLIGLPNINGQVLIVDFTYNYKWITNFYEEDVRVSWSLEQKTIITPKIIRYTIFFALKNGWKPKEHLKPLFFRDIENDIELEIKKEMPFPILKNKQVVTAFEYIIPAERSNINLEPYTGQVAMYKQFENKNEALTFAKKMIRKKPTLVCWILRGRNEAIFYVTKDDVKAFA